MRSADSGQGINDYLNPCKSITQVKQPVTSDQIIVQQTTNNAHKHRHTNAQNKKHEQSAQTKPQAHKHKPEREGAKLVAA